MHGGLNDFQVMARFFLPSSQIACIDPAKLNWYRVVEEVDLLIQLWTLRNPSLESFGLFKRRVDGNIHKVAIDFSFEYEDIYNALHYTTLLPNTRHFSVLPAPHSPLFSPSSSPLFPETNKYEE